MRVGRRFPKWTFKGINKLNRTFGYDVPFLARNLVSTDARLILGFSPKAGCSVAVKWLLYHEGLLDEALAYHRWVHRYRQEVFQASYKWSPVLHWNRHAVKVKVVRNPYHRLVSGYNHAMMAHNIGSHIESIWGILDRTSLSFERFVHHLEQHVNADGWDSVDTHFTPQVLKPELQGRVKYDEILRVEDYPENLHALGRKLGYPKQAPEEVFGSPHHRKRTTTSYTDVWNMPFRELNPELDAKAVFPDFHEYYTPELRERVARLFADDFALYGYER